MSVCVVAMLHKDIQSNLADLVPCDSSPSVSLTFGGTQFDFSPTFSLGPVSSGSSDCVGGVVAADTGSKSSTDIALLIDSSHISIVDGWIAGDVFMSNVYTAFSFDDSSVAFAPLA